MAYHVMLTGDHEHMAAMAKQLDLFGKVVMPAHKSMSQVYHHPTTPYEQFVERYYQQQRCCRVMKSKADIMKDAQEQWKSKFSRDKVPLMLFLS